VTGIWGLPGLPEPGDVFRLGRRLLRKAVQAAQVLDAALGAALDAPVQQLLSGHLGPDAAALGVVSGWWQGYDQVNLQVGLDAWLAGRGRAHTLVGLTGYRHSGFGLADLLQPGPDHLGIGAGSVVTTALPAGPGGQTRACVQCGIYLVTDGDTRLAVLLRGPDDPAPGDPAPHHPAPGDPAPNHPASNHPASNHPASNHPASNHRATLEVACADQEAAQRVVEEVRRLAIAHNVFRGQVIAFGGEMSGPGQDSQPRFPGRPRIDRNSVVLPPAVIEGLERQVIGVARHAGQLLASGQHLKRGVLLHGAPGTGKTHTVRYLLGRLPGVTVVVLSAQALGWIAEACSVARMLQPSVVVVEDVDLIADERGHRMGQHPLLLQLLNEMDGLSEDIDVTFLLTTNRPDVLETTLAARPGRVDHAVELPFPDADARRKLIELYRGSLVLDLSDPEEMVTRTDGVTAAFLKELLRRAALLAAEAARPGERAGPGSNGHQPPPLRVTDAHMDAALNQLLDVRAWLTRTLLGERSRSGQDAVIRPMGADLVIRRPRGYRPT
jgi:cell division protease FtsH